MVELKPPSAHHEPGPGPLKQPQVVRRGAAAITEEDRELFTPVILLAEKYGKTIKPLMVMSNDPFYSIVHTARAIGAAEIVMGVSGSTGAEVQMERLAMTWGMLRKEGPSAPVTARVIWAGRELSYKLG